MTCREEGYLILDSRSDQANKQKHENDNYIDYILWYFHFLAGLAFGDDTRCKDIALPLDIIKEEHYGTMFLTV